MKNILFILALLPGLVFGASSDSLYWTNAAADNDMNNAANYTEGVAGGAAAEIAETDTLFFAAGAAAATSSGNLAVAKVVTTAGYSGAWSIAGDTLTTDDAFFDATGTLNVGNAVVANGASGTFHVGSGTGAFTSSSTSVILNGTTAMVMDIDKNTSSFKHLILGDAAIVTMSGAGSGLTFLTSPAIQLGDNSVLTLSQISILRASGAGADAYTLGAGATITGTVGFTIQQFTGSSNTINLPAINYTGTGTITIQMSFNANNIYNVTGHLNFSSTILQMANATPSSNTYIFNTYNLTCGIFRLGSGSGTGTFNFGSGTFTMTEFAGTFYDASTSNMNLQTSILDCAGDFIWGTNSVVDPGTSLITLNGSGAQVITSNNKLFYDIELDNSGSAISYPADSMSVTGDLTLTNGPWSFNSENHYVAGDFSWSADDSLCLDGNLTCGGSFTFEGTGGFSFTGNLDQTGTGDFMWNVSCAANRIYGTIKQGAAGATTTWAVPGATNRYPIFEGGSQWQGSATGTIAGYINAYFIPDNGDTLWNFNGAVIDADSGEIEIHAYDPGDIYIDAIDAANVDIDPRPYHSAGSDSLRFHYLGAIKVRYFNGNTQSNSHGAHYLGAVDFVIGAGGFRINTNASTIHTLADRTGGTFVDTGAFTIGDDVDFNAGNGTYEIGGSVSIGDGDVDLETASWTLTGTANVSVSDTLDSVYIASTAAIALTGDLYVHAMVIHADADFTQEAYSIFCDVCDGVELNGHSLDVTYPEECATLTRRRNRGWLGLGVNLMIGP